MLYPTLSQPMVFVIIFSCGLIGGVCFNIFHILTFLSGNDKCSKIFFDFLATIFVFVILFVTNLKINYGQFRIYIVLTFLAALFIEQVISKFLWTKYIKKWYNHIKEKVPCKKKKTKRKRL